MSQNDHGQHQAMTTKTHWPCTSLEESNSILARDNKAFKQLNTKRNVRQINT